jgi:glycosyltransferase involved in cell wall biosynthesis
VKNHELLLRAFQKARAENNQIRLWVVGDGSERRRLEALTEALGLADDVTFWGQQLDVGRFFSAADIFIMSSLSEGLPMSLLQAFSAGLPAIVTDVGGMAEVVRMTRGGIITPAKADLMSEAILSLAAQNQLRESYSSNARAGFDAHFSVDRMAEAYMRLYGRRK